MLRLYKVKFKTIFVQESVLKLERFFCWTHLLQTTTRLLFLIWW